MLGVDTGNCSASCVWVSLDVLVFVVSVSDAEQHTSVPSVVKGRCCEHREVGSLARKHTRDQIAGQAGNTKAGGGRKDRQYQASRQQSNKQARLKAWEAGMQNKAGGGRQASREAGRWAGGRDGWTHQTSERTEKEGDTESDRQPESDFILKSIYGQPLCFNLLMLKRPQSVATCIGLRKNMVFWMNTRHVFWNSARIQKFAQTIGPSACRFDRKLLPNQPATYGCASSRDFVLMSKILFCAGHEILASSITHNKM